MKLILGLTLVAIAMSMSKFAMNKPHMLFQVSSREPEAINVGWGYWARTNNNDNLRWRYKNTNNQLYCAMTEHDGENHFREIVNDTSERVFSEIKYQSVEGKEWEALITMDSSRNISEKDANAFIVLSIENNDYKKVDLEKYSSEKQFVIRKEEDHYRVLVYEERVHTYDIRVSSTSELEIIGLNANVSDNWNVGAIVGEYVKLKNIQRGLEKYSTEKKVKEWQQHYLGKLKADVWEQPYPVVILSVRLEKQTKLHVSMLEQGSEYEGALRFNNGRFRKNSEKVLGLYSEHPKQSFLQHVIFNLLGGITYYYGPLYSQHSIISQDQTYTHSTTPSRLIFPRCFLWDDGFHLTILAHNHPEKTLRFWKQWIDKIDLFGWIAREQIRGYQISAMMPDKTFIYQDTFEGNPPTLMLPIRYLIKHNPNYPGLRTLLEKSMWKLEKWFRYFKTTQSHFDLTDVQQIDQEIKFRWRCKDSCQNGNFMGSGLDDYPRQDSKQLSKQHVDLISWLYFFAESLQIFSEYLNIPKGQIYYRQLKNFYNETLHKQYLDTNDYLFKDVAVSKTHNINGFVTHVGYINLFPFMMGMVNSKSPAFAKILEILQDPKLLWSDSGIRSLSLSDPLYGTGDNYWRGAVWMPINYMVLRACTLYYPQQTEQLYRNLKQNLVQTVQGQYEQNGYLYENYHEGLGNRGFPFYGWTSLINPIILDLY